jgi:hypothetical protein
MEKIISKKNLLHLVEQNLKEMAMDFETPDRPDSGIERKLAMGNTGLKKVPFPKTGEEPNKNFQEVLASERYKQLVDNLRRYLGQRAPVVRGTQGMMQLQQMLMQAHNEIVRTERAHRAELEALAIEIVMNEMGLQEGDLEFDAKIVGMDEISIDDFNTNEPNDANTPTGDDLNLNTEVEIFNDLEKLNLEKAKRRLVNSIIQGASARGHYMYHTVSDRLGEITNSPNLIGAYGVLMSINDINYWQMSDELINGSLSSSVAGEEQVTPNEEDPENGAPKVIARGINFPVLVHELLKGVMEAISLKGRSDIHGQVVADEDMLKKEVWDLRLGPAIWDRMRSQFPEDILVDENKKDVQNLLLMSIFELPAKQFLAFMKEVMGKTPRGRDLINQIIQAINSMLNQEQYESAIDVFRDNIEDLTDNTDFSNMNGLLSDLGISTTLDFDNLGDEFDDEDDDDLVR